MLQVVAEHLQALRVLSVGDERRSTAPGREGGGSKVKEHTFSSRRSFSFLICASISSYK